MSTIAAAAQTATASTIGSVRHVIQYCYEPSLAKPKKFNPARDRRVGLLAIGQCLRNSTTPFDSYAPASAGLVNQLKTRK